MRQAGDLSDFERGMIVGARRAGFSISDAAELLGFSRATVCRVYRDWAEKDKTSSDRQLCGKRSVVDQRRMDRLVQADRKASIPQLTARYNEGSERMISERTTRRILRKMGYIKQKTTPEMKELDDDVSDSKEKEAEPSDSAEAKDAHETQSIPSLLGIF
ncbi:hypothetical protein DNTS_031230 [Danionella cerebrum]|uniref:Transposase Tc1-like domain-containing protein n=1 Tax=Danionella cerebrum TaxID=2873325 RepID=A0A553MNE7_9TELE|nr:hypothetical protein DNTS_031230 [Danionella translucida]